MRPSIESVERFDQVTAKVVEVICVALLGTIVLTICASVFARFVVFYPLNFADALAKYLMQWMAFLGVGLAIRSGEHVLVDALTSKLANRLRLNLFVFANILMMGLFAAMVWHGVTYAMSGWSSRDVFVFGVSMAVPYFSVPVGAAYAFVATACVTWIAIARARMPQASADMGV